MNQFYINFLNLLLKGSPNAFWLKKIATESTSWFPGTPKERKQTGAAKGKA